MLGHADADLDFIVCLGLALHASDPKSCRVGIVKARHESTDSATPSTRIQRARRERLDHSERSEPEGVIPPSW